MSGTILKIFGAEQEKKNQVFLPKPLVNAIRYRQLEIYCIHIKRMFLKNPFLLFVFIVPLIMACCCFFKNDALNKMHCYLNNTYYLVEKNWDFKFFCSFTAQTYFRNFPSSLLRSIWCINLIRTSLLLSRNLAISRILKSAFLLYQLVTTLNLNVEM